MSTSNYFVVPGFRTVILTENVLQQDMSEDGIIRRRIERILARKPLSVDWARYFFFDDEDPSSTLRAWDAAKRVSASVAAFRAPVAQGPWGGVRVVGTFEEAVN